MVLLIAALLSLILATLFVGVLIVALWAVVWLFVTLGDIGFALLGSVVVIALGFFPSMYEAAYDWLNGS